MPVIENHSLKIDIRHKFSIFFQSILNIFSDFLYSFLLDLRNSLGTGMTFLYIRISWFPMPHRSPDGSSLSDLS